MNRNHNHIPRIQINIPADSITSREVTATATVSPARVSRRLRARLVPGGAGFGGFPGGPGFGPRGPRRAGKGDIRSVILSLLSEGPSNGYGLIKAIAEKTGGAWRPSPGSVYPTLQQLVDEELIVSTGDGRKTEFDLTDAGRTYVSEHAEDFAKAWEATPGRSEQAGAFFESVGKLMGVAQQFRHSATDAQRAAAIEKLDETRRALYLILAD